MDLKAVEKEPFISIVMCTYNSMEFIESALKSILQQSYTNWELIISDDGSSDGTREYLNQFNGNPKVRLYFQDKNIGYVANKNFVISKAKGIYITQNDSDDISTLDRLEQQVSVVLKFPEVKIVACGYNRINKHGEVCATVHPEKDIVFEKYMGHEYPFWFPPLLVHKEVYEKIGVFTSYFAGMGDDLYWTVKANELYKIYCVKAPLYNYRNSPNSITNVLNDNRKLIVPSLLNEILKQRKEMGTDWLEQKNDKSLLAMEEQFLKDKKLMVEQIRIWAAKAVDFKNKMLAKQLLLYAFKSYPEQFFKFSTSLIYIRTYLYYLRTFK